jgi:hypothetical protein
MVAPADGDAKHLVGCVAQQRKCNERSVVGAKHIGMFDPLPEWGHVHELPGCGSTRNVCDIGTWRCQVGQGHGVARRQSSVDESKSLCRSEGRVLRRNLPDAAEEHGQLFGQCVRGTVRKNLQVAFGVAFEVSTFFAKRSMSVASLWAPSETGAWLAVNPAS